MLLPKNSVPFEVQYTSSKKMYQQFLILSCLGKILKKKYSAAQRNI